MDTSSVLKAAETKWNFIPFKPGIVGGHCIGVDPYYLTHKAQSVGHHPEIVLAGRRVNDGMGKYVARQLIHEMGKAGCLSLKAKVLILGISFKENCPDLRNSKVVDVISELREYGVAVDVCDPWVSQQAAKEHLDIELIDLKEQKYSAMLFAVAHDQFKADGERMVREHGELGCVVYDLKRILPSHVSTACL